MKNVSNESTMDENTETEGSETETNNDVETVDDTADESMINRRLSRIDKCVKVKELLLN